MGCWMKCFGSARNRCDEKNVKKHTYLMTEVWQLSYRNVTPTEGS